MWNLRLTRTFLHDLSQTVYRQCIQEHNITMFINKTYLNNSEDVIGECQPPWGMVPEHIFPNLWRIIYWSSQFLTWLISKCLFCIFRQTNKYDSTSISSNTLQHAFIVPLMQSYLKAGDFTFKGKFKAAIIDNAIYYGSYLFICGILLVYIALKPDVSLDWPKLKAIASSASNTWGLFLLVLLLGNY